VLFGKKKEIGTKINELDERAKQSFATVKKDLDIISEELDDHREVINQHDDEIRDMYVLLEKLKDQVEEHTLMLGNTHFLNLDVALTNMERRIMLVLYTSEYLLTLEDISKRLKLSEKVIQDFMDDLKEKGIPIHRQNSLDNKIYYYLDQRFKDLQTKKNFLKFNDSLNKQILQ
jgi:biotin operon repressor